MSTLPESTSVLIVGAGPIGLTMALALQKHGVQDIVIVDAQEERENYGWSSRASMIHAATLEALDTVGLAEPLTAIGVKGKGLVHHEWGTSFTAVDITSLASYTPFPYALLLPQSQTEEIFTKLVEEQGIKIHRPYRAAGLSVNRKLGGADVTFDNGEHIRADYVVGADGSHSVIREASGIAFRDPDELAAAGTGNTFVQQLCHADLVFSGADPLTSPDYLETNVTPTAILMSIPLPPSYQGPIPLAPNEFARRIAFNVPASEGVPPQNPNLEFLQDQVNRKGPASMSSDVAVNSTPTKVSRVIWSSRYKMRYAVAETFAKVVTDESGERGALVTLVGDAGHTHSPLGGQGMNLGVRDAMFLAPVLAEHILAVGEPLQKDRKKIEEWAASRRERALKTITMTKALSKATNSVMANSRIVRFVKFWAWRWLSAIPFIKRMTAWRFAGLGNR
ncbi:FAD/NAD(P)-binding domain-containing protein [Cylindrobasidium torrendii FP15055 ss-10]|uniref:FAD/NAD(P)-binding domain-containing protein n=1 Tax=Cylindrobasidium torrendii FP15055 ss-10 TaxID=1314674 RepID=A0A0D7BRJ1_9AGAR|nr:FAD/NAD(P)-binding domain-containing protein [Cylindrobasidium torrendii FP15055 ss-10]